MLWNIHLSGKQLYLILLIVFVCSFFLQLYEAWFLKELTIYRDELLYLHLNESIFNQGQFLIRDVPYSTDRILYSLVLWPASFFVGTVYYTFVIAVINSFFMALMVPISFWLSKICRLNTLHTLCIIFLAAIIPDLMYAMTFMSENLYLPLSSLVIAMAWQSFRFIDRKKCFSRYMLGFAVLFCLLCLTKKIGGIFLPAYIFVVLWLLIKSNIKLPINKIFLIRSIGVFVGIFFAIYFSFQYSVFPSMNHFFAYFFIQKGILNWIYLTFLVKACIINFTWVLLAYFFFPVLLPVFYWKRISDSTKQQYLFVGISFMLALLLITYMITGYETFPDLSPRQHLRYFSPLFIPIIVLFFKSIEETLASEDYYINKRLVAGLIVAFTISVLLLKIPFSYVSVDQTMLTYVLNIGSPILLKVMIVILIVFFGVMFIKNYKYKTGLLFFLITTVCIINRFQIGQTFYEGYKADQMVVNEIIGLKNDVDIISGNVLFLDSRYLDNRDFRNFPSGIICQYIDTYMPNSIKITTTKTIADMVSEKQQKKVYSIAEYTSNTCQKADYILSDEKSDQYLDKMNLDYIKEYPSGLILYKNMDPNELMVSAPLLQLGAGWSGKEGWGRWGEGKVQELLVVVDKNGTNLTLWMHSFYQPMTVDIYQDNNYIQTIEVSNEAEHPYEIRMNHNETDYSTITLVNKLDVFPSPQEVGVNNDTRLLGFGLSEVDINGKLYPAAMWN